MGVYGAFSMAMICHDFQRLPISYPHGLLKKAHLRVPNRMHLCQNFGEKNGSNPSSYSYYIITIADICTVYIYIHIGHTIYIYMVALHVVFPLWTPFAIHWPMCWGLVWRSPVWILRFVGVEEHHLHHLHQLEPRDQGDDHFHNPEKIAWLMGEFLGNYI